MAPTPAVATSPRMPVEATAMLDGEPRVGDEVVVRLSFYLGEHPDLFVRLHASPLVELLDHPWVKLPSEATSFEPAWRFRVTGEGFWSLAVSAVTEDFEPHSIGGVCCGFGWSGEEAGAWDRYPMEPFEALPPVDGHGVVTASVRDGQVHLVYNVTAAPWLSTGRLSSQLGPGYIMAHSSQRAVSTDHEVWETDLAIADGDDAIAYAWSSYEVPFPRPNDLPDEAHTFRPMSIHGEVHCQNMKVSRDGESARVAHWRCGDEIGNALHGAPAPGFAATAPALALLALLGRRLKG